MAVPTSDGVPRDYAKAREWLKKAADKGQAEAMDNLGIIYANGKGVPPDLAEAARWFRKAADKNVPEAMDHLAYAYATGKGVALDYQEALRFYRRAADKGLAAAQFDIGTMYENGRGVPRTTPRPFAGTKGQRSKGGRPRNTNSAGSAWMAAERRGRAEALRWYARQANMESLRGC